MSSGKGGGRGSRESCLHNFQEKLKKKKPAINAMQGSQTQKNNNYLFIYTATCCLAWVLILCTYCLQCFSSAKHRLDLSLVENQESGLCSARLTRKMTYLIA
ncbi:hypothetical protein CHARACLAT_023870 [Characodon lateralis]|uniref:Uncharacterized protein n=1 Tax=Characodon lateralis TaxID=208331 RepID=A0ABU7F5X2_9TELE|nr:hypothetical protein [Characodon lateralis]